MVRSVGSKNPILPPKAQQRSNQFSLRGLTKGKGGIMFRRIFIAVLISLALLLPSSATFAQTCAGMSLGQLSSLNGFVPFPSSSLWNIDISTAPVDPASATSVLSRTQNRAH